MISLEGWSFTIKLYPRTCSYTSTPISPFQAESDIQTNFSHMCPKDFVSNRNISNIFEEASPQRDKLMFIGLKARGIFESRRDVSP